MLIAKKNRIISSFTLGYLLCLVNERLSDEVGQKNRITEKIFLLHKHEIISAVQSLHRDLFGEFFLIKNDPQISSDFFLLLKSIYDSIKEKNHWGDDSFLETAFLSGSFLCLIDAFDDDRFSLQIFEQILTELFNAISVTIDYNQFSSTITKIRSAVVKERICSRDEIFYMISGAHSNHKEIVDIQNYIDNPSILQSICLA
jgi:hypothetical protein